MSSDAETLRYAARRATLYAAIRDGDALAAARAAARLRIPGRTLAPFERARARDARRALGLALVKARLGTVAAPAAPVPLLARPDSPHWRRRLAAVAVAAAVLVVLLFGGGTGLLPGGGSPEPPPAAEPVVVPMRLVTVSRGRTISLAAEVVAEASPSPTPTPAPSPSASAEPTLVPSTAEPGAGSGGSGSGGSGGGAGGGSGRGTGVGVGTPAPTPTPTPAPTATPPVPPLGYTRLNVIVYDWTTLRPLADVCVVIGTLSCGPDAPHTDLRGRWSADVAATPATTQWDMLFIKAGFITQSRRISLPGGVSRTYAIYLRRG